jgi:predicted RNA-binding Zn ribbon-like protein
VSASSISAPLLGEPLPVELMNTMWVDRAGIHDALGSPADTGSWLRAVADREDAPIHGVDAWFEHAPTRGVRQVHLDLRSLRDASRSLAARLTDDDRPQGHVELGAQDALRMLNARAASAPSWPALTWPEGAPPSAMIVASSSVGFAFVGGLARATVLLFAGEGGDVLRACRAPGCALYFVKQHPRREWCSAACGNRARQARHYRRHAGRGDRRARHAAPPRCEAMQG